MAVFTYEEKMTADKLETYEWDRAWWDNTKGEKEAHIFILGDSISCGYRENPEAAKVLCPRLRVDGLGTSKGIDNNAFKPSLDLFFSQQLSKAQIIFFNNGLHGWHLDTAAYEAHYKEMVKYLKTKCADVVIVLTTPVRDNNDLSKFGERISLVRERNEAAKRVAEAEGCRVLDFYSLIENKPEIYSKDGVHLTGEGYEILANEVYNLTKEIVK